MMIPDPVLESSLQAQAIIMEPDLKILIILSQAMVLPQIQEEKKNLVLVGIDQDLEIEVVPGKDLIPDLETGKERAVEIEEIDEIEEVPGPEMTMVGTGIEVETEAGRGQKREICMVGTGIEEEAEIEVEIEEEEEIEEEVEVTPRTRGAPVVDDGSREGTNPPTSTFDLLMV
jgi:hypothetical protein